MTNNGKTMGSRVGPPPSFPGFVCRHYRFNSLFVWLFNFVLSWAGLLQISLRREFTRHAERRRARRETNLGVFSRIGKGEPRLTAGGKRGRLRVREPSGPATPGPDPEVPRRGASGHPVVHYPLPDLTPARDCLGPLLARPFPTAGPRPRPGSLPAPPPTVCPRGRRGS